MALTATTLGLALLSLASGGVSADPVVVRATAAAPAPDGYWPLNCATLLASPSVRYAALNVSGSDACGLSDGVFYGGNVVFGNDSMSIVSQCWLFVVPTLFIPPGLQPPPAAPVQVQPQVPENPSAPPPSPAPTQASRIPMAPPTAYEPHQLSFVNSSGSATRLSTAALVGTALALGSIMITAM